MYVNDGRYGGKQLLQPETVQLLVENQIPEFPGNDHGLGWELSQIWYMDGLSEASTLGHTGYTGTSIVINKNNDTIAILLTNRVHPTRATVSTNPARRQFAQQVADAIPVSMPNKKEGAWFSGYGGLLDRTLTAEVNLETDATLSFDTWYRTEQGYDFGVVEVSSDGVNWNLSWIHIQVVVLIGNPLKHIYLPALPTSAFDIIQTLIITGVAGMSPILNLPDQQMKACHLM